MRLVSLNTRRQFRVLTDSEGRFQIALPPGKYVMHLGHDRNPHWLTRITAGETTTRTFTELVF